MPIPAGWQSFVDGFGANDPYWFFPKRSVGNERLADIVAVYREFDGRPFDQDAVLHRLAEEDLSGGTTTAQIRVLRKGLENLGFCWVDNGILRTTPLASAFVDPTTREEAVQRQLWRYRLTNPINPSTKGIQLFPHRFLVEVLLETAGWASHDEYALFIARSRRDRDRGTVVSRILAWRRLRSAQRSQVKNALPARFATIEGNAGYSMAFHRLADYFERGFSVDGREGLKLKPGDRPRVRARVADHKRDAVPIVYQSIADCIVDYGDAESLSTAIDAVDHYLDTSQYEKAVEAFKQLPVTARGGRSLAAFRDDVFLEKHLEDYLVDHLGDVEAGLTLVKRQQFIIVGAIDILAKAANGDLVVIELKKTRASDKVFGQLCRYMGCVARHHTTPGQAVRGYIIGSEIDDKLRYAASVLGEPKVYLKRFRRDPASPAIFVED